MPVQIINAGPGKCKGYLGASAIRKYGKMVKEGHLTDLSGADAGAHSFTHGIPNRFRLR